MDIYNKYVIIIFSFLSLVCFMAMDNLITDHLHNFKGENQHVSNKPIGWIAHLMNLYLCN